MPRATRPNGRAAVALALLLAGTATGCGDDDGGGVLPSPSSNTSAPTVDPARFGTKVDNPYYPLVPGTKYHYSGTTKDGPQTDVVEVTRRTKKILGVRTVVVKDVAAENGKVVEATSDWFAQDHDGNVWYFGEDSKTIENGKVVSTEGSWEAGKRGAKPGIIMEAKPKVGDRYRQEFAEGVAEDRGAVLSTRERVKVPAGSFTDVLKTKDDSPLEPKVAEHKFYAKGIGAVREEAVKGEKDELALVRVERP